jgi:hypothetical protein
MDIQITSYPDIAKAISIIWISEILDIRSDIRPLSKKKNINSGFFPFSPALWRRRRDSLREEGVPPRLALLRVGQQVHKDVHLGLHAFLEALCGVERSLRG